MKRSAVPSSSSTKEEELRKKGERQEQKKNNNCCRRVVLSTPACASFGCSRSTAITNSFSLNNLHVELQALILHYDNNNNNNFYTASI
mmetsp:Transcript_45760/g.66796  ORF Transcript_45760/g.66796 Transcript_45760/m.66796 type:complete len:88 (-) Transcript_45760:249-512(-)